MRTKTTSRYATCSYLCSSRPNMSNEHGSVWLMQELAHQLQHSCLDAPRNHDQLPEAVCGRKQKTVNTRSPVKLWNSSEPLWHLCRVILDSSAWSRVTFHSPHSCGHFAATSSCLACLVFVQILHRDGSQCAFNGFPTTSATPPQVSLSGHSDSPSLWFCWVDEA